MSGHLVFQGAEAITVRFTAEQVLEKDIFNVHQVYADSEEEVEDVSENEDWEELQPRA